MSVAFPSSPARAPAQRVVRFVLRVGLVAGVFLCGIGVGARWHEPIAKLVGNKPPPAPPPVAEKEKGETIPSGEALLVSLDRRMLELRDELAAAERAEREAEVACNLLRKQGALPDAPAYREQQQLKARATARKNDLTTELTDANRLRAELLAAMADQKVNPGTGDPELTTRIRTFVIRQELLRDPAPK